MPAYKPTKPAPPPKELKKKFKNLGEVKIAIDPKNINENISKLMYVDSPDYWINQEVKRLLDMNLETFKKYVADYKERAAKDEVKLKEAVVMEKIRLTYNFGEGSPA